MLKVNIAMNLANPDDQGLIISDSDENPLVISSHTVDVPLDAGFIECKEVTTLKSTKTKTVAVGESYTLDLPDFVSIVDR